MTYLALGTEHFCNWGKCTYVCCYSASNWRFLHFHSSPITVFFNFFVANCVDAFCTKKWFEIFFDNADVVVVDTFSNTRSKLSFHFVYSYVCNTVKTFACNWDFFVKQKASSVVSFTRCFCCVLNVDVFGSNSVPFQIFKFETCLPTFAVAAFVKHNFAITCVCQIFIYKCDCNLCHFPPTLAVAVAVTKLVYCQKEKCATVFCKLGVPTTAKQHSLCVQQLQQHLQ